MPPRSIWSGSITFGLVNVPIKLLTAVSPKDVRFNQLHKADGVRIQQKRVCPADGQEVSYDDIVKGYEISPGNYVVVDPDELAELSPAATHTVDIEEFVDLEQIDPIFFEHAYYLIPDARAEKAYALLTESMRRSGRVAIAKMVLRTKQYLCAIRAVDNALVLSTLYYDDEVKQPGDLDGLPGADIELSEKELTMAEQLIESLTTKFDPSKFTDEYRDQLLDIINRKAEGEELVVQPAGEEPTKVVDLMAALEASIAAAKKHRDSA